MYGYKIKRGNNDLDCFYIKMKIKEADSDEKTGYFKGMLSVFGNVDGGEDRVIRGAFQKTLKEKPAFPYLLDHNPREPAGYFAAKENSIGLEIDVEMPLEDPRVKQRFRLIKLSLERNSPMGQSIGYRAVKFDFEEQSVEGGGTIMVRNLQELKLYEGSSVVFPMNELATVTDAKASELLDGLLKGFYTLDQVEAALSQFKGNADRSEGAAKGDVDPDLIQSMRELQNLYSQK